MKLMLLIIVAVLFAAHLAGFVTSLILYTNLDPIDIGSMHKAERALTYFAIAVIFLVPVLLLVAIPPSLEGSDGVA